MLTASIVLQSKLLFLSLEIDKSDLTKRSALFDHVQRTRSMRLPGSSSALSVRELSRDGPTCDVDSVLAKKRAAWRFSQSSAFFAQLFWTSASILRHMPSERFLPNGCSDLRLDVTEIPSFIKALLIILKRAALLCQLAFEVHHLDLQLTNPLHLALELVEESGDFNLLGLLDSCKRLHGLLLGVVLSLNLLKGLIFDACQHADDLSRQLCNLVGPNE